jgi:hypothetical protein
MPPHPLMFPRKVAAVGFGYIVAESAAERKPLNSPGIPML